MPLLRLKLWLRSPWRTPWQADTLTGMLMSVCARTHGADVLRRQLMDPMCAGQPPFVLSDACPGDLLPLPVWLRLAEWPEDTDRKHLKRARWLQPNDFLQARLGKMPASNALITDEQVMQTSVRQHNTLGRLTDTTGDSESGLGIFNQTESFLHKNPAVNKNNYLSVYIRTMSRDAQDLCFDLFYDLSLLGFGADASTGRGQFEIRDEPEVMTGIDAPIENANAVIALSTFQPGPTDPIDGMWDAFPKFGKLGPDLGVPDVRKNTLILFRPGACFRAPHTLDFLGRTVPMDELFPTQTVTALTKQDLAVVHPAFALTISASIDTRFFS